VLVMPLVSLLMLMTLRTNEGGQYTPEAPSATHRQSDATYGFMDNSSPLTGEEVTLGAVCCGAETLTYQRDKLWRYGFVMSSRARERSSSHV